MKKKFTSSCVAVSSASKILKKPRLLKIRSITHLGFRRPRYNITKKIIFFREIELFTHFILT